MTNEIINNGWYVSEEFNSIDELKEKYMVDGLTSDEALTEIAKSFVKGCLRWKDGKIQVAAEGSYATEEEW